MPDIVLDYHRLKTPIDHPDRSIVPSKLDLAVKDRMFIWWLIASGYDVLHHENPVSDHTVTLLNYTNTDMAYIVISHDGMRMYIRNQYPTWGSGYTHEMKTSATTQDHLFVRWVSGSTTTVGYESVDLSDYHYLYGLDAVGSTFKCYRAWVTAKAISSQTPKFTATDTQWASGYYGLGFTRGGHQHYQPLAIYLSPFSRGIEALAIIEVGVEGSGTPDDPYRPALSKQLVEVGRLQGLPDFLYQEYKKYQILKQKGFSDEDIKAILGYLPQTNVDLDSVSIGTFEFNEKAPSNIAMIYSDNPYLKGAVQRQISYARSKGLNVFSTPKDYSEAVELFTKLKSQYSWWLAGKDNFAFMVLGWEELEIFHAVDFYYGELVEHKTHYDQLKRVPPEVIHTRLLELRDALLRISVLIEERDKHLKKVEELLRLGW
jgi:hypothetical protein